MLDQQNLQSTSDLDRQFPRFALLPAELRREIWLSTMEPRLVELQQAIFSVNEALDEPHASPDSRDHARRKQHIATNAHVPAVLQVNHETRNLGLYQQVSIPFNPDVDIQSQSGAPYIWLNWEIDIISLDCRLPLDILLPYAPHLRRLHLSREVLDAHIYKQDRNLHSFVNLRQVYVSCKDLLWYWSETLRHLPWACPRDGLFLVNTRLARMTKAVDVERHNDWANEELYDVCSGKFLLDALGKTHDRWRWPAYEEFARGHVWNFPGAALQSSLMY